MTVQTGTISGTNDLACAFEATEAGARKGISAVIQDLRAIVPAGSKLDDIEITLVEAVNNIVEHAYAEGTPGQISIRIRFRKSGLSIEIDDEGVSLPAGSPPAGILPNLSGPRSDLPEGGFGWFLIRRLANRIQYDRKAGRNRLNLQFDLDAETGI